MDLIFLIGLLLEAQQNVTTADCQVPQLPKLALGNISMIQADVLPSKDSSTVTWSLSIDDQPVNLDHFGTYDYVVPKVVHNPSLVGESWVKLTAWDVVLTNLQPGVHTIEERIDSDQE